MVQDNTKEHRHISGISNCSDPKQKMCFGGATGRLSLPVSASLKKLQLFLGSHRNCTVPRKYMFDSVIALYYHLLNPPLNQTQIFLGLIHNHFDFFKKHSILTADNILLTITFLSHFHILKFSHPFPHFF